MIQQFPGAETSVRPRVRLEPPAVRPLIALLHQLYNLVETLSDEEYVQKPVGVVESSVGGHVRHNLDHVEALLLGLRAGEIDYDHRDRGTAVERDRLAALETILRLERDLGEFSWDMAPTLVRWSGQVAADRPAITAGTSPDREVAFVVSHTIHHNAIIAVMAKLLGADLPADFGYAPSTIAHRRSRVCAR